MQDLYLQSIADRLERAFCQTHNGEDFVYLHLHPPKQSCNAAARPYKASLAAHIGTPPALFGTADTASRRKRVPARRLRSDLAEILLRVTELHGRLANRGAGIAFTFHAALNCQDRI